MSESENFASKKPPLDDRKTFHYSSPQGGGERCFVALPSVALGCGPDRVTLGTLFGPFFFYRERGNIAMPFFRVTWVFKDQTYDVGWSETLLVQATDANDADTQSSGYHTKRLALTYAHVLAQFKRVCNIDHPRDSRIFPFPTSTTGILNEATNPMAGLFDVLVCRRDVAAGTFLGRMFMRMVPMGIFIGRIYSESGSMIPPNWNADILSFSTEVASGKYYLNKKSGASYAPVAITNFLPEYRGERKLGRPFDRLRGRRAVA